MTPTPFDAWVIRRLLTGAHEGGAEPSVSEPFREIVARLGALPLEARPAALDAFLCDRPEADAIRAAVLAADPDGPPPPPDAAEEWATLADIRRVMSETRWLWNGWIPTGRIVGIGAAEGTGKSRFACDLARRIYRAEPWPDGQAPSFSEGTRTVWLCADANQDDLAEIAPAYGLPDEAIVFATARSDPYGGVSLDDPDVLDALVRCVETVRPALVFIDTLTNATARDLCSQQSMKPLKEALATIFQGLGVTVVLQLHLSREGQALGRRIKGLTRTLIHLECPDPSNPERLRAWVEKSFGKKPPPLGVTMGDQGNTYDFDPPSAPKASNGGRPPEELAKAIDFLTACLSDGDRKQADLVNEWMNKGGAKGTVFNAFRAMEGDGRLVIDTSVKPKVCHLVKNPVPDGS